MLSTFAYKQGLIFCVLALALPGCSKKSDDDGLKNLTTDASLAISVKGIQEDFNINTTLKMSSNAGERRLSQQSNDGTAIDIVTHVDFDAVLSVGSFSDRHNLSVDKLYSSHRPLANLQNVTSKPMAQGVKYRLILRQKSNGHVVYNDVMTSGADFKIDVVKGQTYEWIAYSYNSETVPPAPSSSNLANATITTGEGEDLLHATGEVTVVNTASPNAPIVMPLGIVFKHSLRRVMVELNTMGMFANLLEAEIELMDDYFRKGVMNVSSGVVVDQQVITGKRAQTTHKAVDGYEYNDRRAFYFYTTRTDDINNFRVTLKRFKIALDEPGLTREFNTPVTYTFAKLPAGALGRSVLAKIDLVESALTVGGVAWARSNLYYQAGHNPYRFGHMNRKSRADNTFFTAFTIHPRGVGNRVAGDPCEFVYPQGLWATPTKDQLESLKNSTSVIFGNYGTNISFTPINENTAAPYPHSKLHFNLNGRINGGLLGILVHSGEDRTVEIWSDNRTIDLLGLANLGISYFKGENHQFGGALGLSNTRTRNVSTTLLGDVELLGLSLIAAEGYRNVRCVRK
ncbi:hypothetical protein [Sphingobacterium paucimobilis]|nr:hypothetical protein [Sphingobacterium paucimobilis]